MTIENIKQEDLDNKVSTGLKLVDLWVLGVVHVK